MAFKPALCELHEKHPVCTKIGQFEIENRKKISGEGAQPPPQTPIPVGRGTTPPRRFGASILSRSNLAFPQFFFRKRPLNFDLVCEGSADVVTEKCEKIAVLFRRPLSLDVLPPAEPRECPHKCYITRNYTCRAPALHFYRWQYASILFQIYVVGSKNIQESCAIAKMTAQCALHMGSLKNFGTPRLRPRTIFPIFSWVFVPIDPMNVPTKFEVDSFTRSWDNREYAKNLGSPWIRPRCLFSKIFNGL